MTLKKKYDFSKKVLTFGKNGLYYIMKLRRKKIRARAKE
jgi:hypothetical protein